MTDDRIEKEYSENVRSIEDLSKCLLADFDRWQRFENEIERLETLFREIGSMFDAKMFGERPLEEKQEIVEVMKKNCSGFSKIVSLKHFFSAFDRNSANIFILCRFFNRTVSIFNR